MKQWLKFRLALKVNTNDAASSAKTLPTKHPDLHERNIYDKHTYTLTHKNKTCFNTHWCATSGIKQSIQNGW